MIRCTRVRLLHLALELSVGDARVDGARWSVRMVHNRPWSGSLHSCSIELPSDESDCTSEASIWRPMASAH